jgi:signal transduction histidine kinase
MRRSLVWLQIALGWLPIWVLFTLLIASMHPNAAFPLFIALRMIVAAAALGVFVERLTERVPWPQPFRFSFVARHVFAAVGYSAAWLFLNSLIESVVHGRPEIVIGPGFLPFFILGVWLYIMVTGVSYTTRAGERAARAEATATRSQLAALRSQLNPHFLFNALHTIVHLIPREPGRAAEAAEQLGGLLRDTVDEDRDLVSLAEERAFVARYLELQSLRFGDRLQMREDVSEDADEALIPSFALLTLVENAIEHAVEMRAEPTEVWICGSTINDVLVLTVQDTGNGLTVPETASTSGTGLKRLRERLVALYGSTASLDVRRATHGFVATLRLPLTGE